MAFEFSLKYVCSHEGRQGTSPGRNAIASSALPARL